MVHAVVSRRIKNAPLSILHSRDVARPQVAMQQAGLHLGHLQHQDLKLCQAQ